MTSPSQNGPLSSDRLAEIRDLNVDSCSANAPYNADVWTLEYARMDLLAEVARLKAENARLRVEAERDEQATGNLIDERDSFHALLDKFAAAVAPLEVIGEHSSGNDPWLNALDMVTPAAEVDQLKADLAEMESAATDWAARLLAQAARADKAATTLRKVMRGAVRRVNELAQLRDAVQQDGETARAERLAYAIQEIRALFADDREDGGSRG